MQIIWQPLINLLIVFYHLLFSNLGLAIIALTALLRLALAPLTTSSLRAAHQMRELAPELARLKQKHKGDRARLMQAQADFYKEKGINPARGCLPQIAQLVVLIALFQGFMTVFRANGEITSQLNEVLYPRLQLAEPVNIMFFGRDLTSPDVIHVSGLPLPLPGVFVLLAVVSQFLISKMSMPQAALAEKAARKTEGKADDIATAMQQQMLYLFPLFTIYLGYIFPLGLILYWGAFSLFQGVQQYFVSGWGGLAPWVKRVGLSR